MLSALLVALSEQDIHPDYVKAPVLREERHR
jgi:hypothetical protein